MFHNEQLVLPFPFRYPAVFYSKEENVVMLSETKMMFLQDRYKEHFRIIEKKNYLILEERQTCQHACVDKLV